LIARPPVASVRLTSSAFTMTSGDGTVSLDGAMYGVSAADRARKLTALLETFMRREDTTSELYRLLTEDFEGVVVLHDGRDERTILINDLLGRYPVFYTEGRPYAFARSLRDVLGQTSPIPDPIGAAQYLTFNHCVGGRTPFAGVRRLPAATMVSINAGRPPEFRGLSTLNLDEQSRAGRSLAGNAEELVDLFSAACRARAGQTNVVSLSGGLDSRSVVGGLLRNEVAFELASFHNGGASTSDVRVGRRLAELLGQDYEIYEASPTTSDDADRLLTLLDGQNIAEMGFIQRFFDRLIQRYGPGLTCFTGDGGDKAMPLLSIGRVPRGVHDLVEHLLSGCQAIYPAKAAEIAGIRLADLNNNLVDLIESYPESLKHKYARFAINERAQYFIFNGEERNRRFFDHAAPFFAPQFFTAAMGISDRQKRNYRLYREFLTRLSPELARLPYANAGSSVTSSKFRVKQAAKSAIKAIVNTGAVRAKILRRTSEVELGDLRHELEKGAPGLSLAGFLDRPNDYSVLSSAAWRVYTLAWMYRRFVG
jgi:asparagine synthase (glutamine-hydrolysing)